MANASGFFGGARIQPSKPLAAASLNRLQDAAQSARARSGVGCLTRWTPAGTIVTPLPGRRGRSGATSAAFQLLNASTESQKKIRVRFGTVATSTGPWLPTGMSHGDTPEYIFDVADNGYVALIVTVDSETSEVNSVTIGELPVPTSGHIVENTAIKGHLILGSFATTDGTFSVTSHGVGDQAYLCCGGLHYFCKA